MSEFMKRIEKLEGGLLSSFPEGDHSLLENFLSTLKNKVSIDDSIKNCNSCSLSETCLNKVISTGNLSADIMMIGEAPGRNEDEQGEPFVGKGGNVLDKAIQAVGWKRSDLYITNTIKCRPPNNRNPLRQELVSCYAHLSNEINFVNPKVIICVGSTAAKMIIHPDFKITKEQGVWFDQDNRKVIAIYHPSYLLRIEENKKQIHQAKWDVFNALKKVDEYLKSDLILN